MTGHSPVDHLVYAVPDLEEGVRRIAALLGVSPTPGGRHEGLGTANALVGLGGQTYLEIIGPDPEQPEPVHARPFGIDALAGPRLVTWAVREGDLEGRAAAARAHHYDAGEVVAMSRRRADGVEISWRLLIPPTALQGGPWPGDGLVPFFIDWGETPHPATSVERGALLIGLTARHPDPAAVRGLLRAAGVELPVDPGETPQLTAVIGSPAGRVELG
jgi:hypothetical protein